MSPDSRSPLPDSIASLRKDYALASLSEADVNPDPLLQFDTWLQQAIDGKIPEPTAMSVATVNAAGQPSSRILLLKGRDATGFKFYTNYASRKGVELAANPNAAILFHWVELEREVRIEGVVERTDAADSDEYYASRPLKSRIGAIVSPQSRVIPGREWIEEAFAKGEAEHGASPTRPAHWGGYRLVPHAMEFWQGRRSRLHDRLRFTRVGDGWTLERLAP